MSEWSQSEAIQLAKLVESVAPQFGCHVGLTGGCLYKEGLRKDCDLVFYRIRQVEVIDIDNLIPALEGIGIAIFSGFGFCYKCGFKGKSVDLLFPDEPGGAYQDEIAESLDGIEQLLEQ